MVSGWARLDLCREGKGKGGGIVRPAWGGSDAVGSKDTGQDRGCARRGEGGEVGGVDEGEGFAQFPASFCCQGCAQASRG